MDTQIEQMMITGFEVNPLAVLAGLMETCDDWQEIEYIYEKPRHRKNLTDAICKGDYCLMLSDKQIIIADASNKNWIIEYIFNKW